ncbi:hypothetical protein D3C81_2262200 [compost metagenome]
MYVNAVGNNFGMDPVIAKNGAGCSRFAVMERCHGIKRMHALTETGFNRGFHFLISCIRMT